MFKNRKNMKEMVRLSKMLIEGELELEKIFRNIRYQSRFIKYI